MVHSFDSLEDLVMHFEGLYLNAYLCPAGIPTIGYGHTSGVKLGDKTTEAKAKKWLAEDLAEAAADVDRLITVELTKGQRDALTSFVFNLGAGRLEGSTLRKLLNSGKYSEAAAEFGKWVFGTDPDTKEKVKLNGLVYRREAEQKLFQEEGREPKKGKAKPTKTEAPPDFIPDFWENSHAR